MSSVKHIRVASILLISAALVGATVVLSGGSERSEAVPATPAGGVARPITVTDATFDKVTGNGVVLIDFWATWCGYCQEQKPILARIAAAYAGRVTVGEVDFDRNKKSVRTYRITGLPTLIVFKGGKVHKRMVGLQSEKRLRSVLDAALD